MADLAPVLVRLQASADRLAVLGEETRAERERHAELVCEARDGGASWARVAAAARRSPSRCVAIVNER